MATTNAKVSSASLSELQNSLMKLATELDQLRDLMNADMTNVNAYWDDPKYQEFKECYSKQIQKCGEISEKYFAWSDKVLSPTIERVVKIEMTDVGASISGGGVSAASTGGAAVGGAGASAATSGVSVGKANNFNMGESANKRISQETTTCTEVNGSVLGNGGSTKTCVTDRPDGTRTTKVTSCTTTGASASVGIAKGGFTKQTCQTTTIDELIKNSKN